jgi:hypothetical protein
MEEIKVVHYQLGGKKSPPLEATEVIHDEAYLDITNLITSEDGSLLAIGKVFNDKRFIDGTTIRTSRVEFMNLNDGLLKTRNTLYKIRDLNL